MRVLVTMPDLQLTGGVSNYFRVLRPYLEEVAEYFTVGFRSGEASAVRMLLRLVADYARFTIRLLRGRYDLVHINTAFARRAFPRDAVFYLLAKALRRRVLVFVRGGDVNCLQSAWTHLFPLAYGRVDAFIVLASEHAAKLRSFGYAGRIDRETTVAATEGLPAASAPRERNAQRFRILFLARLEKAKGLYEAIEAYRLVKQQHDFAELVIAGDGTESELACRYVQDRGISDVLFRGQVAGRSKAEAFVSSDVYLFPSYYEGMPNSVLEAMAYGLPVVTTAVGGIADFFEDGQMGYSTESADPAVLAGFIARLIADPDLAARMGSKNRRYAEHFFAAPAVARRLLRIYSRVVATGS